MGLFGGGKAYLVTLFGQAFECQLCAGRQFLDREVKLNTTGLEFMDLAWLNKSATGLVCDTCGYVHLFAARSIELWEIDGGYPEGTDEGE